MNLSFMAIAVNGSISWWLRGHDPRFAPLCIFNIIIVLDHILAPPVIHNFTLLVALSYEIPHTNHSHLLQRHLTNAMLSVWCLR
jgi:hypothetical protein